MRNICKPCQMSASGLRSTNKVFNDKEENLVKSLLESSQSWWWTRGNVNKQIAIIKYIQY